MSRVIITPGRAAARPYKFTGHIDARLPKTKDQSPKTGFGHKTLNTTLALLPPMPLELESAVRSSASRAWLGT